jgi:NarL family two-component system response regulator YdfI
MADTIRIFIADDHTMVRQGVKVLLETDPRMKVVGEAADGEEALRLLQTTEADVVLLDLRMPRVDGITALKQILERNPDQAVIILTTFDEDDLMRQALGTGARGYLLKDMSRDALLRTVEAAARGETLLDPSLLARVLSGAPSPGRAAAPGAADQPTSDSPLTDREKQVLRAIADGNTSKSAAAELGITERTVKAHLTSVFDKLGVDTRAAAIAFAIEKGWL